MSISELAKLANLDRRLLRKQSGDATLYVPFGRIPWFQLRDLQRPGLGAIVGVERRTMPTGTEALGEYQARRVNRLIVEAVCPDESLLKRGKYLSTSTGLAHLFPLLRAEGREIRHAVLYAHPAHYPRVQRQFLEAAAVAGDGGFFRSACRRVPLLMSDKTCYRPQAALKPVEGQFTRPSEHWRRKCGRRD